MACVGRGSRRGSRETDLKAMATFQASNGGCSDENISSVEGKKVADLKSVFHIQETGFAVLVGARVENAKHAMLSG